MLSKAISIDWGHNPENGNMTNEVGGHITIIKLQTNFCILRLKGCYPKRYFRIKDGIVHKLAIFKLFWSLQIMEFKSSTSIITTSTGKTFKNAKTSLKMRIMCSDGLDSNHGSKFTSYVPMDVVQNCFFSFPR